MTDRKKHTEYDEPNPELGSALEAAEAAAAPAPSASAPPTDPLKTDDKEQ